MPVVFRSSIGLPPPAKPLRATSSGFFKASVLRRGPIWARRWRRRCCWSASRPPSPMWCSRTGRNPCGARRSTKPSMPVSAPNAGNRPVNGSRSCWCCALNRADLSITASAPRRGRLQYRRPRPKPPAPRRKQVRTPLRRTFVRRSTRRLRPPPRRNHSHHHSSRPSHRLRFGSPPGLCRLNPRSRPREPQRLRPGLRCPCRRKRPLPNRPHHHPLCRRRLKPNPPPQWQRSHRACRPSLQRHRRTRVKLRTQSNPCHQHRLRP